MVYPYAQTPDSSLANISLQLLSDEQFSLKDIFGEKRHLWIINTEKISITYENSNMSSLINFKRAPAFEG